MLLGATPVSSHFARSVSWLSRASIVTVLAGGDCASVALFNQSWSRNVRSYGGWDGASVEINPETGEIASKYVSCGLAGIASRLALMNYVFSRGKTFVANTWAKPRPGPTASTGSPPDKTSTPS